MITQEMVKVAVAASDKLAYETVDEDILMKAALTAAYPLIRQQVINECVEACVAEAIFHQQGEKTNYLPWREFFKRQAKAAISKILEVI